jgi:hypothetical protein
LVSAHQTQNHLTTDLIDDGPIGIVPQSHQFKPAPWQSIKHGAAGDASTASAADGLKEWREAMKFFIRDLIAAHREPLSNGRIRPWRPQV